MSIEITGSSGNRVQLDTLRSAHVNGSVEIPKTGGEKIDRAVADLLVARGYGQIRGTGSDRHFEPARGVVIRDIDRNGLMQFFHDSNPYNMLFAGTVVEALQATQLDQHKP